MLNRFIDNLEYSSRFRILKGGKISLVVSALLLASSSYARTDLGNGFWLEDNGVTITCASANVGNTSSTPNNGVTYTKIQDIKDVQGGSTYAVGTDGGIITDGTIPATQACTSGVTSLNGFALGMADFNENISHWDTSSITDMNSAFYNVSAFNQDISKWDTSNVTNMGGLFWGASAFNQNIGDWNTSKVTNIGSLFRGAISFNQDISKWDTSKVTYMTNVFDGASVFNQDISGWDLSAINAYINANSNTYFMSYMFNGATAFNQNLNCWNVKLISEAPSHFDTGSGFVGNTSLQPRWGQDPVCVGPNTATTFNTLTQITTEDNVTAVTPFSTIELTDGDSTAFTATISLDDTSKGTLSATTIASGNLATVQAAIRAITFTPTQNRVAVRATETTTITLKVTADGLDGTTTNDVVTTSMNDAPTNIALSSTTLNQSAQAATVIGGLTTTDSDMSETFTYTLVSGFGDNSSFAIDGSNLKSINANMTPGTYSIKVNTNDGDTNFEKEFTITVIDDIAPVITTSSTLNVLDGSTTVVTLSSPDSGNLSWSIADSSNDNDAFSITTNGLLTLKAAPTKSSYTVTVTAYDGANTITKTFTVKVANPLILNYQGFLAKDGLGVNKTLSMTFKLYDALTGGTEVWSSTEDVVVTNGIYNVELGKTSILNNLDIVNNTFYLGITVESNNEMTPRQSIAPSGYIKILADRLTTVEAK